MATVEIKALNTIVLKNKVGVCVIFIATTFASFALVPPSVYVLYQLPWYNLLPLQW